MPDVLDGIVRSRVVVEGQNRVIRELSLQDIFGKGELKTLAAESVGWLHNLAFVIRLWISCQGLGGWEIHRIQARFLIASMVGCSGG